MDDSEFHDGVVRQYSRIQSQFWHLVVVDPQAMYESEYGAMLARVKRKIATAEAGAQPNVSPTFAEQASADRQ